MPHLGWQEELGIKSVLVRVGVEKGMRAREPGVQSEGRRSKFVPVRRVSQARGTIVTQNFDAESPKTLHNSCWFGSHCGTVIR